jgi:hypothetical protein
MRRCSTSRTISDIGRHGARLGALVLLVCPVWALRAGEIYKTIDSEGHVVYSDRAPSSPAPTPAAPTGGAGAPPDLIHFCWTNCFTLSFANGLYRRTDGADETWSVERFTSASIILHRHDVPAEWNGFNADVIYEGEVANDRLINLTVNGNPASGIDMAWGTALNTLPGSNAERDQAKYTNPPPPANIDSAMDIDMRAAEAPPALLNDEQPPCTEEGYLWTPGYWAWGGGYYWVPGAWVRPARVGVLWTPGYWEFVGAIYTFHRGYWGPHVGFYGGINYGFGYGGVGFSGGRWVGNSFAYNAAVNHLDTRVIHSTYSEPAVSKSIPNRVSYNGGPGGTTAAATAQERAAAAEPHMASTPVQRQIAEQAAGNPTLMAHVNKGPPAAVIVRKPTVAAAPQAAGTRGTGALPAHTTAATPNNIVQPHVVHSPRPTPAPPQIEEQPVTPKPAAPKPVKVQAHRKE